jgi:tetratricopeptide (TPR) repeat protein
MDDTLRSSASTLPTASAGEFVATFAIVLAAIAAFLFLDEWLARVDRAESRAHAANLYAEGRALLAQHQPHEASARFAAAVQTDRSVAAYQLGLAEAMLDDGRPDEAERALATVLERAQTDGRANLIMARVLARQRRMAEAKSYYHRAIYGAWGADSLTRRLEARLELIRLLSRAHAQRELLAELLPIQEAGRDSLGLQRLLGHLFIEAGSPERGVEIFRKVLQQSPEDGDAYEGMGEAALALGNYQRARADFDAAARLLPDDTMIASNLRLADTVLALDPLVRGIGHRARTARSRQLLVLTLERTARCAVTPETVIADSARRLLAIADSVPADSIPSEDADGEPFIDTATELASSWRPACPPAPSVTDRALRIVLRKLAG